VADKDIDQINETLTDELLTVRNWFNINNNMTLNPQKCKNMLVAKASKLKSNPILEIAIDNHVIQNKTSLNLVGVEIDNQLNFNQQTTNICKKINKQLGVLSRFKNLLSSTTKKALYQAYILPHLLYCSDVWQYCGKRNQDKIEKLNERALRFVLNERYEYNKLLEKLSTTSVMNRCKQDSCITVYKALHDLTPKYIKELLHERQNIKNLRGKNKLTIPKVH